MAQPKEETVTARVEPKVKRQVEKIAAIERRTISSAAAILLEEALEARQSQEQAN